MKYSDGQEVRVGDRVKLGDDSGGIVVASLESGDFSPACSKEDWHYLKKGIIVDFPSYGRIHYEEPEPDLELIGRS